MGSHGYVEKPTIFLIKSPTDSLVFKEVDDGRHILGNLDELVAVETEIITFSCGRVICLRGMSYSKDMLKDLSFLGEVFEIDYAHVSQKKSFSLKMNTSDQQQPCQNLCSQTKLRRICQTSSLNMTNWALAFGSSSSSIYIRYISTRRRSRCS